jgi:hypothetical protein
VTHMFCHFLRSFLASLPDNLSAGVNQSLDYGRGFADGVCLFSAAVVMAMSITTASSNCLAVSTLGSPLFASQLCFQSCSSLFVQILCAANVLASVVLECSTPNMWLCNPTQSCLCKAHILPMAKEYSHADSMINF